MGNLHAGDLSRLSLFRCLRTADFSTLRLTVPLLTFPLCGESHHAR
jgi:hypothetical protein